jgi:esterase
MEPQEGFVTANGLRFHYLEWGVAAAPPLVLLHGFGNEAHIWDLFAPLVAGRYRVLALDSRGHGDSDHAAEYGDEHNLADLEAILDALGITRLTLVGFSMGGGTATIFASRNPDRLERLVIVDRGPETDPRGRERMARAISKARSSFPSREDALAYIRLANPRRPEELVQKSVNHAFRASDDGSYELKQDRKLREGFGHRLSNQDGWAMLDLIRCPTLIVRGGDSDILAPDVAQRMADRMPDARLEVVPNAGHPVMMDNPAEFNRVVADFLLEAYPSA